MAAFDHKLIDLFAQNNNLARIYTDNQQCNRSIAVYNNETGHWTEYSLLSKIEIDSLYIILMCDQWFTFDTIREKRQFINCLYTQIKIEIKFNQTMLPLNDKLVLNYKDALIRPVLYGDFVFLNGSRLLTIDKQLTVKSLKITAAIKYVHDLVGQDRIAQFFKTCRSYLLRQRTGLIITGEPMSGKTSLITLLSQIGERFISFDRSIETVKLAPHERLLYDYEDERCIKVNNLIDTEHKTPSNEMSLKYTNDMLLKSLHTLIMNVGMIPSLHGRVIVVHPRCHVPICWDHIYLPHTFSYNKTNDEFVTQVITHCVDEIFSLAYYGYQ